MEEAPSIPTLLSAAAVCGVFAHHAYFIRGEHMINIPPLLVTGCIVYISAIGFFTLVRGSSVFQAANAVTGVYTVFAAGCLVSTLVYRICFHRLHQFPGPFLAKTSKLYHVWCIRKLDQYRWLDELHQKYGPVVRTGPSSLSICQPEIVELVHGARTRCRKPMGYDASYPETSLQMIRDKAMHEQRRRSGWDQAFTTKALRCYDSRLLKYMHQLEVRIKCSLGQPIDLAECIGWYSFDVMGDLTFGQSYDGLASGKTHWAIDAIRRSNQVPGLLMPIPWLAHLLTRLPSALNPQKALKTFSASSIEARKEKPPAEPDIMSHLLGAAPMFADPQREDFLLQGDARLLIIAGSDTTATTITYLSYYLAARPSLQRDALAELTANGIRESDSITVDGVRNLPFLNAIIKETLRLHPPVSSALGRDTPKEGLQVGDTFIPGGVTIQTPNWSIQRNAHAFVKPNEFIPERWTSRPELVLQSAAYMPFSIGAFSCIGKQLAYNETRTVIAMLVLSFKFHLAADEDGDEILHKFSDVFVTNLGALRMVFELRKNAQGQ